MKFVDWLRKLGIYRSGAVSGTYTNAKERPTELQMEGVFNAEKDLISKKDAGGAKKSGLPLAVLIINIIVGLFIILIALTSTLAWLIILLWLLWLVLLFLIFSKVLKVSCAYWLIFIILTIGTLLTVILTQAKSDSTSKEGTASNGSSSSNSATAPAADETASCIFPPGSQPQAVAGYVADVFSSEKKDVGVGEKRTPTNKTSFQLSDFTMANDANLKETVYFTIWGDSGQFIPGVTSAIQLCNASTGKTTVGNDLTSYYGSATTDNTSGVEQYFSWVQAPSSKGKYYIDGLAKINGGEWKLLDRLEIEFK